MELVKANEKIIMEFSERDVEEIFDMYTSQSFIDGMKGLIMGLEMSCCADNVQEIIETGKSMLNEIDSIRYVKSRNELILKLININSKEKQMEIRKKRVNRNGYKYVLGFLIGLGTGIVGGLKYMEIKKWAGL